MYNHGNPVNSQPRTHSINTQAAGYKTRNLEIEEQFRKVNANTLKSAIWNASKSTNIEVKQIESTIGA